MQGIIEHISQSVIDYYNKTGKCPTKIALGIEEQMELRELLNNGFFSTTHNEDQVMGMKLYKTNKFNELEVAQ